MKKVLILYAHPSPNKSQVNRYLYSLAESLDHVEARDLYDLYPNLHIDVEAEQGAIRGADVVVFQFPIYWFSSPSILKEWQDTVLTSTFAYGEGEQALQGKEFMVAVTTGGAEDSYQEGGRHGTAIEHYLLPFEQTARFCGMSVLAPFVVQEAGELNPDDLDRIMFSFTMRLRELGGLTNGN